MSAANRQTLIIALLLLWLCLTGSHPGWNNPYLLTINALLGAGLVFVMAYRPRFSGVPVAIVGLMVATIPGVVWHGAWDGGAALLFPWVGYLAIANCDLSMSHITRAAQWAILPYTALALLIGQNTNVIAFGVTGLGLLGGGIWVTFAIFVNATWLHSAGGLLAMVGAAVAAGLPRWALLAAPPLVLLDLSLYGPSSYQIHWQFLVDAATDFVSSPLVGIGPGNYISQPAGFWHAHNIVASTAAELGIIGLIGLAGLVWAVYHRWPALPGRSQQLLMALAVWSLVDEPLRFWGIGAMAAMSLRGNE